MKTVSKIDVEKKLNEFNFPCTVLNGKLTALVIAGAAVTLELFSKEEYDCWYEKIEDKIVVKINKGKFKGIHATLDNLDSQDYRSGASTVRVCCDGVYHKIKSDYLEVIYSANTLNVDLPQPQPFTKD
jgi:hypothetical protein